MKERLCHGHGLVPSCGNAEAWYPLARQARQLVDAIAADSVDHGESGLLRQIAGQSGVNLGHGNFARFPAGQGSGINCDSSARRIAVCPLRGQS